MKLCIEFLRTTEPDLPKSGRPSRLGREHLQADITGFEQSEHRRERRLSAGLQRLVDGYAIDAVSSSNCRNMNSAAVNSTILNRVLIVVLYCEVLHLA